MKRNNVFFSISLIVIFSMLAGLTTSTAQALKPTTLNVDMTSAEVAAALPREETLYFNGLQWGSVVCWNPYSSDCNNAMAIAQQDNARVTICSKPHTCTTCWMASSFLCWRMVRYTGTLSMTEITFKIKTAAHWSDGTPVTAEDVAYTWATNIKYETNAGDDYQRLHRYHRSG